MKFDLSQMKVLHHGDDHTVFAHPEGHEIRVMHKALAPKVRGELARMAEKAKPRRMAEGGMVGGAKEVVPEEPPLREIASQPDYKNPFAVFEDPAMSSASSIGEMQAADSHAFTPPATQAAAPAPEPEPTNPALPQAPAPTPVPQEKDPFGFQQEVSSMRSAGAQAKKGLAQQATAEAAQGKEETGLLQSAGEQLKATQDHFTQNLASLTSERNSLIADYKAGHIDPNHFVSHMETLPRIGTAIGLILGGMGGGLTGEGNPVLKYLNAQIDRDIDAQKANLGKTATLLEANFKQFGNLRDATDMTKVNIMDLTKTKMQEAAARAKDPLAQARLLQESAKIDMQLAPLVQKVAQNQAVARVAQGSDPSAIPKMISTLRTVNPEMAKDMEKRYVPGVGLAAIEVPDKEKQAINMRQLLNGNLQKISAFAKQHSGSLDPQVIQQGKALAANTQDLIRRANAEGVFREGEQRFNESIVPSDPTKFFGSYRTIPIYNQTLKASQEQLNAVLKTYGLPEKAIASPNTNAPAGYRKAR